MALNEMMRKRNGMGERMRRKSSWLWSLKDIYLELTVFPGRQAGHQLDVRLIALNDCIYESLGAFVFIPFLSFKAGRNKERNIAIMDAGEMEVR